MVRPHRVVRGLQSVELSAAHSRAFLAGPQGLVHREGESLQYDDVVQSITGADLADGVIDGVKDSRVQVNGCLSGSLRTLSHADGDATPRGNRSRLMRARVGRTRT